MVWACEVARGPSGALGHLAKVKLLASNDGVRCLGKVTCFAMGEVGVVEESVLRCLKNNTSVSS